MSLGLEIRRRRRWLDITQEELAKKIGCHPASLSEWERGQTQGIGTKYLVALERTLQCEPGELLRAYCNDIDHAAGVQNGQ